MPDLHVFKAKMLFAVLSAFIILSSQNSIANAEDSTFSIDHLITGAIEGSSTGLPLPRFVSLKSNKANMRVGPSFDNRVQWIYTRAGLPVEIIQEFDVWRRIRDLNGDEGWVHKSLVAAKRNVVVAPWEEQNYFSIYESPKTNTTEKARLQSGVQAEIRECDGKWCRIRGAQFEGWIQVYNLWGVYPNEIIN